MLTKPTLPQSKDTGLTASLVCLVLGLVFDLRSCILAACVLLAIALIAPVLFRPLAIVWYATAEVIGGIMLRILLGIVFFAVVTPVAVVRRTMGIDTLALRRFKKGSGSVMTDRNHTYTPDDLRAPY